MATLASTMTTPTFDLPAVVACLLFPCRWKVVKIVACLVFRWQIAGSSRVVAFCFSVEELQGGGMSIF